jgi:ABC-type transport system involved in multi-copper enzyme maturation permease subunit
MNILTIARLTFLEAARRRVLLAAFGLGVAFLIVYAIGFHFISIQMEDATRNTPLALNEARNFLMLAGLYAVNFLTVMMTVLTSVDTLSGEISSGTIHTLLSKPIRRWEVVSGKALGFIGMISLYLLLMAGGILVIIYLRSGYTPAHMERGLALMWLNSVVLLSISLFGGSLLSTLANGVLVFGLFGIAFIGGWIEQIGTLLRGNSAAQAVVNVGIVTSLIMPGEALWRRAAFEVQSPLISAIGVSPFISNSVPSPLMVIYAMGYILVIFALTVRSFQRRDL